MTRPSALSSLVLMCACATLAAGCGSTADEDRNGGSPPSVAASCLAQVDYDGASFIGNAVRIEPVVGRSLGEGTIPPCGDVAGRDPDPAQTVEVAAIDDVSSDVAVVRAGAQGVVYIREGLDPAELPAPLHRLLEAPSCEPMDEPIALAGPWRGVSNGAQRGAGLEPPYDVDFYVAKTSAPRYARSYLSIHVPRTVERPGAGPDFESSLQTGASLDIVSHCSGDQFVADRIQLHPPG